MTGISIHPSWCYCCDCVEETMKQLTPERFADDVAFIIQREMPDYVLSVDVAEIISAVQHYIIQQLTADDELPVCGHCDDIWYEIAKAYDHVTGGQISKPNTYAQEVIRAADQHYQERWEWLADDNTIALRKIEEYRQAEGLWRVQRFEKWLLQQEDEHKTCKCGGDMGYTYHVEMNTPHHWKCPNCGRVEVE